MIKVILYIENFNIDGIHLYGMLKYKNTKIELVRELDEYDIKNKHFKTYNVGDETMRFDSKDELIETAHKYCKDKFDKYKLVIKEEG